MSQGCVEMSLYYMQRSAGMVRLLLRISMYFVEFIMPSTGTRLPGPLAVNKPRNVFFFSEGILQSAEDAPFSLVHHCFI
jgi:hypothetical protein